MEAARFWQHTHAGKELMNVFDDFNTRFTASNQLFVPDTFL